MYTLTHLPAGSHRFPATCGRMLWTAGCQGHLLMIRPPVQWLPGIWAEWEQVGRTGGAAVTDGPTITLYGAVPSRGHQPCGHRQHFHLPGAPGRGRRGCPASAWVLPPSVTLNSAAKNNHIKTTLKTNQKM